MSIVTGGDWTGGVGIPAIVFYQDEEPTATAAGQVWVKQSDLSIWLWTGSTWILQADPNLQLAIDVANGAALDVAALQPRMIAVEQDSATYSQAIVDLETATSSIAGDVVLITADTEDNTAAIIAERIARTSADEALSTAINTLQASNAQVWIQDAMPVPGVGGIPDPIPEGSFWYDSDDFNKQYRYVGGSWVLVENTQYTTLSAEVYDEQTARVAGDTALAIDITNLWSQRNTDAAYVVTVNQARIDGDVFLAQQYAALNTTVGDLEAQVIIDNQARIDGDTVLGEQFVSVDSKVGPLQTTVEQHTTSINGIEGKYTVKIDNNGYISGFGLIATNNNASPTSTFTVLADNFRIVTPGSTPVSPFYVAGGITYIRNVKIDEAAIGNATIGTLNIKNSSISNIFQANYDFFDVTGPVVANGSWTNLSTAYGTPTITVNSIVVPGSTVMIRTYINCRRAGSEGENGSFRIRRDDGVILQGSPTIWLGQYAVVVAWEYIDPNPVSTSHTYTVQVGRRSSGTAATGRYQDIQLIATLLKR
jgi:hypothetical protein